MDICDISAWKVTFVAHNCKDNLYQVLNTYIFVLDYSILLPLFYSYAFGRKEVNDESNDFVN